MKSHDQKTGCYSLKLNHGTTWKLTTASASIRPWIQRLAGIMELDASPAGGNGEKEILFIQDDNEEITHSFTLESGTNTWKCHNLNAATIWYQDVVPNAICKLKPFSTPDIEVRAMWNALYPVYLKEIASGGMPFHAALLERNGRAVLLAGRHGTGKSTSCNRLRGHWHALCDDETLIVVPPDGHYMAHPFPTWSHFIGKSSQKSWNVQRSLPIFAIFFMEQADEDKSIPMGEGEAAVFMRHASAQICHKYWKSAGKIYQRSLRNALFDNACSMAHQVPAFKLNVSRHGRFWENIEQVLGW